MQGQLTYFLLSIRTQLFALATQLRDRMLLLIGIDAPSTAAFLALLAIVLAVFVGVFCIAALLQSFSQDVKLEPICVHGIRTRKFCPQCAREEDIIAQIHKKMNERRAGR